MLHTGYLRSWQYLCSHWAAMFPHIISRNSSIQPTHCCWLLRIDSAQRLNSFFKGRIHTHREKCFVFFYSNNVKRASVSDDFASTCMQIILDEIMIK